MIATKLSELNRVERKESSIFLFSSFHTLMRSRLCSIGIACSSILDVRARIKYSRASRQCRTCALFGQKITNVHMRLQFHSCATLAVDKRADYRAHASFDTSDVTHASSNSRVLFPTYRVP